MKRLIAFLIPIAAFFMLTAQYPYQPPVINNPSGGGGGSTPYPTPLGLPNYLAGVSVPATVANTGAAITGVIPGSTVSGDLLIAALKGGAGSQPSAVPTAPVGWSLVGTGAANIGGSPKAIAAFYSRTSNGTDSNPTFTFNANGFLSLGILDFHGLPNGSVDTTGTVYTTGSGTSNSLSCGGVVGQNEIILALMAGTNGSSDTTVSIYSNGGMDLFRSTLDDGSGAIDVSQVTEAVTGTRVIPKFSYSNANSQTAAYGCIFVH